MTGPPERRRPLPLPGDSGPSETRSACVLYDTLATGSVQGHPRLIAELRITPGLNSRQRAQLEKLGVTREATHRSGLGWNRVTTIGRLYVPSPDGDVAAIQPVWTCAPSIYRAVARPHLHDLIAWNPAEPEAWFYRLCIGPLILGEDLYLDAIETGGPLTVFSTPLEWLRAEGQGCVFLTDAEARWAAESEAEASAIRWGAP